MKREPVSAVLITKNAALHIEACLDSIRWADEIIVLDSGSSDGTVALAKKAGATVHQSDDWPGFGPQRQRAQQYASHDWIFMIDVDERVTPQLRQSIENALLSPDANTVFRFNRLSDFFGRFIKTSGWYPDRVVRLYHAKRYAYNNAMVHEKVACDGARMVDLEGHLLHYTTDSYQGFMAKSLSYAQAWAEERHGRGKRTSLGGIALHTAGMFLRKYLLQRGFTEGKHGLLLAWVSSVYTFNKYACLWTLQQSSGSTQAD